MCACRHVCDERWANITRSIKLQAAVGLPPPETLRQPTWCHLQPQRFANVAQRVPHSKAENILLTHRAPAVGTVEQQEVHAAEPEKVFRGHIVLTTGEQIEVSAGVGRMEVMHHVLEEEGAGEQSGVDHKFIKRHFLNRPAVGPASRREGQTQGGRAQHNDWRR